MFLLLELVEGELQSARQRILSKCGAERQRPRGALERTGNQVLPDNIRVLACRY